MVSHVELWALAGRPDTFSLAGEYLRGATAEVEYVCDGALCHRTHIIVEAARFPRVRIAVEGSSLAPAELPFFALPPHYESVEWELAAASDLEALRRLIAERHREEAASRAAVRAELARRARVRHEGELAAFGQRSTALQQEAMERLLQAWRGPACERRWRVIIADLYMISPLITREGDRLFIASVAAYQRNCGGVCPGRSFAGHRTFWLGPGVLLRPPAGPDAARARGHQMFAAAGDRVRRRAAVARRMWRPVPFGRRGLRRGQRRGCDLGAS